MRQMIAAVIVTLCTVVTGFAGDGTLSKPDVLGEENVMLTEKLSKNYDTFIVRDFSTEGAEIVNMNDEEKGKLAEIKPEIVKLLTDSIVKHVKKETAFKTVSGNTTPKGRAVVLEGKFTRFNAGHGAAKFFLGWVAPEGAKTNISVSGRLVDSVTGKELATFNDTRSGGEGSTMGFVGHVYRIQAKDQGEEIAEFIKELY